MRGRLHAVCDDCGKIVKIDKPGLGSMHFCTPSEDESRGLLVECRAEINRKLLEQAR